MSGLSVWTATIEDKVDDQEYGNDCYTGRGSDRWGSEDQDQCPTIEGEDRGRGNDRWGSGDRGQCPTIEGEKDRGGSNDRWGSGPQGQCPIIEEEDETVLGDERHAAVRERQENATTAINSVIEGGDNDVSKTSDVTETSDVTKTSDFTETSDVTDNSSAGGVKEGWVNGAISYV